MNVRFKPYITIQETPTEIIISGLHQGLRYEKKSKDFLDILKKLKSVRGLNSQECLEIKSKYQWITDDIIEPTTNCKDISRTCLFYDYLHFDFDCIKKRKILVFGAGAAGGTITYLLAQHGFENLYVLDYDCVETSDIFKTMVYDIKNLGEKKLCAIQRRIHSNFGVDIFPIGRCLKAADDAINIISDILPAIVIYAIDPDSSYKLVVDKYCVQNGIPIIHASYSYENIICGPCVVPGNTACFCGFNEYWKQRTKGRFDYESMPKLYSRFTIHPSISYNINTLSSIIVKDVIFLLGKEYAKISTLNKILRINLINNEIEEDILSCKFCVACNAKVD